MAEFRRIGVGNCGSVWTPPSKRSFYHGYAFKREEGGGSAQSLFNDFDMHKRVLNARYDFSGVVHVYVPRLATFVHPDDVWWSENPSSFPPGYPPSHMIVSERIPPIQRAGRDFLIRNYCAKDTIHAAQRNETNEDCLVRPYLGKPKHLPRSRVGAFTLRNFALHLDQINDLDTIYYAELMAEALAMMHWGAGIDAAGVEFVLAQPPAQPHTGTEDYRVVSNDLGEHVMWILDFDSCHPITADDEGVARAAGAFFNNNPYFPRPSSERMVWNEFCLRYLDTSSKIFEATTGGGGKGLAAKFLSLIENDNRYSHRPARHWSSLQELDVP